MADADPSRMAPRASPGEHLRRLRQQRSVSLGELSRLTHYSKGYLSKVETGRKPLTHDVARRCDMALATGGELATLVYGRAASCHRPAAKQERPLPGDRPPMSAAVLHTLPRDIAAFTGRDSELGRLIAAATAAPRTATVLTIDGMPGVGKTALAVHAAHLVSDAFPDGQLFVNLHAHTQGMSRADPASVLADLLSGTGTPPAEIPHGLHARAARWRAFLADRRVLLVLDDAADHDQVEPLLPGAAGCLVLITSRRRLVALDGAAPLTLDTMPPDQAAKLFARLVHRGPLTGAEADTAAELVRLCGYLPLAIALLAGRLAHHPAWRVIDFAVDFAGTRDRLGELSGGNRAVAAAFQMSYRDLPDARQRLFRHLSLHPGTDVDAYATAALAGISVGQARAELEALYTDHLVDEPAAGRYRMHDLLRAYAQALVDHDDSGQAIERLLGYYEHAAAAAGAQVIPYARAEWTPAAPAPRQIPPFPGPGAAMAWMRSDNANLLACLAYATTHDLAPHVLDLTAAVTCFHLLEGPWQHAAALHSAAVALARRLEESAAEAAALQDLGRIRYMMGEYAEAAALQERAVHLCRETGDRLAEAKSLQILARVHTMTGDYAHAADLLERELRIVCEAGHRHGEAITCIDLARIRYVTGDFGSAAILLDRALVLNRQEGHPIAIATTLYELGHVRHATGDLAQAADLLNQAGDLYRHNGNRNGEANVLHELGRLRHAHGDHSGAAMLLEEALLFFQEARDPHGQAETINSKADLLADAEGPQAALPVYREALRLSRDVGIALEEGRALEGIARCADRIGDRDTALARLRAALVIYRRLRVPGQARVATRLREIQAVKPHLS
ncbi:ATPase [Microbispora sp. NBRC 16548]|nr:ATPase [Microbispora sp. NBRC 16548]